MIGGRDISKARVDNEWPSARQPRPLSSSESSISNGSIYVTGVIEFMPVKGGWRRLEMRTAKCVHSVRVQHSLSACTSPYDGSRCVLRPSFARNSIFDACRVSFSMTLACPAEFDNHPFKPFRRSPFNRDFFSFLSLSFHLQSFPIWPIFLEDTSLRQIERVLDVTNIERGEHRDRELYK